MGDRMLVNWEMQISTVEMIDNEADRLNMSRSEYIRKHFQAGRKLFQASGKLDREMLADLVEDDESAHLSDDLTTDAENLVDEIKAVLPTNKDRALTNEEIHRSVFGTIDEQRKQIEKGLEYLDERGQVKTDLSGNKYIDG